VDDSPKENFLGGKKRKSLRKIKPDLSAEHTFQFNAGVIFMLDDTVFQNIFQEVKILVLWMREIFFYRLLHNKSIFCSVIVLPVLIVVSEHPL